MGAWSKFFIFDEEEDAPSDIPEVDCSNNLSPECYENNLIETNWYDSILNWIPCY